MNKKPLNEYLIEELKYKIPNNTTLVNALNDLLPIGKEAIYRRLRGDVSFTLEEASILSYHLGLSLDILKEISPLKRPFVFKMANFADPKEIDYKLISEYVNFLDYIKDSPNTEVGTAAKLIPDALHINYQHIARFYLFKWIYQYDNQCDVRKFEQVKGHDRLLDILTNMVDLLHQVKSSYYIFDKNIFQNFVDDVKYFNTIGLINQNDIRLLKEDLYMCLENINMLASKGINQYGHKTEIYLSNINFEAGFSYIRSDYYKLTAIRAFTMYDISSSDVPTYENALKWMQSLKRASSLISESGEIERLNFFQKQYEIVNSL